MDLKVKDRKEQELEIKNIVEDQNIKFIILQLTDIMGASKSITLPVSQLDKILNNEVMFDGSSIDGFARIEESDMYLYPDLSTFLVMPWESCDGHSLARLICDVYTPDGKPFEGCPRYRLKKSLEKAKEMGLEFYVGPEPEFYIFERDENGNPVLDQSDKAGYFDVSPLDKGEEVRLAISIALEKAGFEVEAAHHECGPGQHEIDFKYSDALNVADNIMTFKYIVMKIAAEHGVFATFMPKPVSNIAGSGMHLNMSMFKNGENLFYNKNAKNELSDEAVYFIGGILENAKAITAITNPTVNSYKRLVPGYEAPVYIAWAHKNRSPLVRVPAKRGKSTRVELRSPDPSCNPYLALAVTLTVGIDGMNKLIEPNKSVRGNIFDMSEEERIERKVDVLPMSLKEAIDELKKSDIVKETLGNHIVEKFTSAKEAEWDSFRKTVHNWEIEEYIRVH